MTKSGNNHGIDGGVLQIGRVVTQPRLAEYLVPASVDTAEDRNEADLKLMVKVITRGKQSKGAIA